MLHNAPARWPSRLVTALVWLLAAGSAVFWALRLSQPAGLVNVPVAASRAPAADPAMVAYLLGARTAPVATAQQAPEANAPSRFLLAGVIAGKQAQQGAALISVDGKPPKPFRVGSQVDAGLVLQSVAPRRAVLAASVDGPAAFALDLPVRK